MNNNGNHAAILEAERQALAQQGALPQPYVPPADWLAQQIAAQEQVVNALVGQLTSTELYQSVTREQGVLNKLREWQTAAQKQD